MLNGPHLENHPLEPSKESLTAPAPERIVAAAVKYGDLIVIAPRPGRHHHVLNGMYALGDNPIAGPEDQGFLTSEGRFVSREVAVHIATDADQIVKKHGHPGLLFSEDLW